MGLFWLGIIVALAPSALLMGWLAWRKGVFTEGPAEGEVGTDGSKIQRLKQNYG
jgi:hypothetical protein